MAHRRDSNRRLTTRWLLRMALLAAICVFSVSMVGLGDEPPIQASISTRIVHGTQWPPADPSTQARTDGAPPPTISVSETEGISAHVPQSWFWIAVSAFLCMSGVSILLARALAGKKKNEANLKRNASLFRQVADNIQDVFWVGTHDFTRLDYISPAYESIWRQTCDSLYRIPMSWTQSLFPHDRQAVLAFLDQHRDTLSDGCSFPDFRIVRPDGSVRWLHVRTFGITDDDGGKLMVGIARDITRSKFFEASLRESEEKWRSLMENAPDHIMLLDLDGHILFANRRFMGLDPPQLIGKPLPNLIAEAFKPVIRNCLEHVVVDDATTTCRVECSGCEKSNAVFELRMGPVTVNRRIVAVAVNSTEITLRVHQEKALQQSEAFHRIFFENAPTGIAIQDFSAVEKSVQKIIDAGVGDLRAYLSAKPDEVARLAHQALMVKVNQAMVDLYQAPSEKALIGPLGRVFKDDDRQHFIDQVVAFTSGQDRYEGQARNVDFKGRTLHLMIRKVVIQRSANGLSKILTCLVDVTPLKTAEKERELLTLQLQQAQKMEAIGTLAGGVAHDFNNILSIILGNAELSLEDIPPDNPALHNLCEIQRASLRAKEIVRQLLGLSRKSEQVLTPMHLMPVIDEAVTFLRATIPANIDIQASLCLDDDVIRADATQIHQIMINLFTNASHAMEESGGRLTVRADAVTLKKVLPGIMHSIPPGRYVRVTVADTGAGIPESIRMRIFDPYFTTKEVGKGTGMGLAVVHSIMKNIRGGIVLTTNSGQGTRFELYFPLADMPARTAPSSEAMIPTGSERILFIDDETMIVDLTRKILDRLGYRVKATTDPSDALSLIEADPAAFDLVITDMNMPGMTGDQLVREIRRALPTLPVILCTGYSERLSPDKVKTLRIGEVLEKPVAMARLAAAIRQMLDRERPWDESGGSTPTSAATNAAVPDDS